MPHIRWCMKGEMPRVGTMIREQCDEISDARVARRRLQRAREALLDPRFITLAIENDESYMVGCVNYSARRDSIVVEMIVVDPCYQRQGYGRRMIERLLRKLSPKMRTTLLMEVEETDLDMQLFLKACGLKWTSTLKTCSGDVYIMAYTVEDNPPT